MNFGNIVAWGGELLFSQYKLPENLLNELSEELPIKLYGLFNPDKLGFTEYDFLDGMHCDNNAMMSMMTQSKN